MAARKGDTGGKGERDVFDPFGFLNDFLDQLSGCCQPNAHASGLDRQGKSRQAYSDMDTPAVPLQSRGNPYNTTRGREGSFTAVPAEGQVGQRTLGEVPSPNDKIAPLVKPGVHVVMPSEAKKRGDYVHGQTPREGLTPVGLHAAAHEHHHHHHHHRHHHDVPATGEFMASHSGGSFHSSHSGHSGHGGHASHSQTPSSHDGHSPHSPHSPHGIAEKDDNTVAYVHRRKQSYSETMQKKSLGVRVLKATHIMDGAHTPRSADGSTHGGSFHSAAGGPSKDKSSH